MEKVNDSRERNSLNRTPRLCELFDTESVYEYSQLNSQIINEWKQWKENSSKTEETNFINSNHSKFSPIHFPPRMKRPRCYLCNNRMNNIHWFYPHACFNCGEASFIKRTFTRDLTGYRALVTGGRIKLGYQIALKLLRNGAEVMITSRYWENAEERYKTEFDYNEWSSRLHICRINFDLYKVDELLPFLNEEMNRVWPEGVYLDIVIHNAAQTISGVSDVFLNQEKELVNNNINPLEIHGSSDEDSDDTNSVLNDSIINISDSCLGDSFDNENNNNDENNINNINKNNFIVDHLNAQNDNNNNTKYTGNNDKFVIQKEEICDQDDKDIREESKNLTISKEEEEPNLSSFFDDFDIFSTPYNHDDYNNNNNNNNNDNNDEDISKINPKILGKRKKRELKLNRKGRSIDGKIMNNIVKKKRRIERPLYPPLHWSKFGCNFPEIDRYHRKIDLRNINTWCTEFGSVPPAEVKEVLIANSWAPFVLNQFLLPRLSASPKGAFIVHVHAKEGHFASHKTLFHTHTNIAKASLAMLTRILAASDIYGITAFDLRVQYQKKYGNLLPWFSRFVIDVNLPPVPKKFASRNLNRKANVVNNISVHGVDPGWFSVDEYPLIVRQRKRLLFPPVDEFDAASRIVYPILINVPSFVGTWRHYVPLIEF